jgi:hypothetical protein
MYKTISNEIIRKFHPCYDPSDVIKDENEELPIKDWVHKYRDVVPAKDIFWLLLRKEFISERDLILFVVWCARELLKPIENPDEIIVNACNVAERYANGQATKEELLAARDVADSYILSYHIYCDASTYVYYTAHAAAVYAAYYISVYASNAAYIVASADRYTVSSDDDAADATRVSQLNKLLTYF